MQRNDLQREGSEESTFENKSQDETEASYPKIKEMSITAGHQKLHQGQKRPSRHLYGSVNIPEKTSSSLSSPHDVQSNRTEQKKDRETIKTSYPLNDGGKKMNNICNCSDIFQLNNSFYYIVFQVMLFPLIIKSMINLIKEDIKIIHDCKYQYHTFLSDCWVNRPFGIGKESVGKLDPLLWLPIYIPNILPLGSPSAENSPHEGLYPLMPSFLPRHKNTSSFPPPRTGLEVS
ncbi:uncharacterized protein [Physeter macrocephalus]|uniref:Uncharacterized protein isoform X1 n=1 Tax=Physeter macrocephalus TaxID=9755 RepID=A0A455ANS3_PHYMC|nr:uncharacterized protein LOC114484677 isoform X1 [Physeter catodon]|eukprot:XP_028338232.1 uncharacterized protein LOC114484677 isoform X1 [Physeter catodon]